MTRLKKLSFIAILTISLMLVLDSLCRFIWVDAIPLQDLNLNVSDLKEKSRILCIQIRDHPDQFQLIDYPIGEWGHQFNAEFLRERGFRRSHGIEIRTESSSVCSVLLEFENQKGAQESYSQMLAFVCKRSRYDCFPYLWVPRWNDVDDMLNHFIVAMRHMSATEIPNMGDGASWLYDPLNDFYYVVFFKGKLLVMVGETGSLENAIQYAGTLESRMRWGSCLRLKFSKLQLRDETMSRLYEGTSMIAWNTSLSTAMKPLASSATPL